MPDPVAVDQVAGATSIGVSGMGALYAFFGNAPNALLENLTPKQIIANVIFCMGAGSLTPGLSAQYLKATEIVQASLAFSVGFLTFLIVPTVKLLAGKVARNPAALADGVRGVMSEALKPDQAKPLVTPEPPNGKV